MTLVWDKAEVRGEERRSVHVGFRPIPHLDGSTSAAFNKSSSAALCFPRALRAVARRMRDFTWLGSIVNAHEQSN